MNKLSKIILTAFIGSVSFISGMSTYTSYHNYQLTKRKDAEEISVSNDKKEFLDISRKVSEQTKVPQKMIFAQLCLENGGTKITRLSRENKNLAGLTYPVGKDDGGVIGSKRPSDESGNYTKFSNWNDFANAYANEINSMFPGQVKTVNEFVNTLADKHYFIGNEALKNHKDHATDNDVKNYEKNINNYITTYDQIIGDD